MKSFLKIFFIVIGVAGVIYLGITVFAWILFRDFFPKELYDKQDLIENFENRTSEIIDVKEYYQSILPENTSVYLEFGKQKELTIFHI